MATKSTKQHYENNPFFIAANGITLLFNLAQGVAVMLVIFAVINLFFNGLSSDNPTENSRHIFSGWESSDWLLFAGAVGIIGLALIMISSLFAGVNAYSSARLAQGEAVSLREAFREAFDKLWSFIWLQIIILVKVVLWGLLLIIPGIIMYVRYSLASVAFFDDTKNLRGNAAIKESLRLTRGAWITTYASMALFNMLTFGAISNVLGVGTNAILYRQYQQLGDKKKPAAHWLSWLTLLLPFAILAVILLGIIFIAVIIGLFGRGTV